MEWLNLPDSQINQSDTLNNPPSTRDNCGVHFCIVRSPGQDGGSCALRVCFWTRGCFMDY